MKLTCLGRYGPYPAPGGATTSYLVQTESTSVVVDLGTGALSNLLGEIGSDALDAILLSHLHADHISDMRVLAYMLNPAVTAGKRKKLKVFLPDSPQKDYEEIASQPAFETVIIDAGISVAIGDISVSFQKTIHPVLCYAMRLRADGSDLVYSADSVYDEALIPFVQSADLFLCDAAFSDENRPANAPHMTGAEAGKLAKLARVKRLMLTHINPQTPELSLQAQANAAFAGAFLAKEHAGVAF